MSTFKYSFIYILLLTIAFFTGCQRDIEERSGDKTSQRNTGNFDLIEGTNSGILFNNKISETNEVHGLIWDAIYYGGGVGIGDFNNDGKEDIFFAGNQVDDALYINKGDFQFEDISESSGILNHPGWSTGVAVVDINADGYLDIYVSRTSWKMDMDDPDFRSNKLFINNGDLTFDEKSASFGLDYNGYSTQATFTDFDKDGDLDMFLLNSPSNNLQQKVRYADVNSFPDWTSDKFYINNNGVFEDATEKVGVMAFSYGLGVVAADLNHDTWPDIYVANDYERPDYMYINQKDGTFKNMLNEKIKHTSFTSMGCDAADFNNDGLVDIGVLDMQASDHVRSKTNMPSMNTEQFWGYVKQGYNYQYMSNVLQVNHGVGFFTDIAQYAGLASTDWSWAILMADFNNDQWKDVFVTNGINKDLRNNDFRLKMDSLNKNNIPFDLFELSHEIPSTPTENCLFLNKENYKFKDESQSWNCDQPAFSFGAAYADFDNDGDLDLVVNNNNRESFLYKNEQTGGNYLDIEIKGSIKNPKAIGAKVFIFQDDLIQYQELNPIRGFQSSCSYGMHFGLGYENVVDSLVCIFPDDRSIRMYDVKANQQMELSYADAKIQPMAIYRFDQPLFKNITDQSGISFTHKEDIFNDFKEEVLLPHAQSRRGPYQAVGDVNQDGLTDVFLGGASGQSGTLYLQNTNGTFQEKSGPWSEQSVQEDMGCLFFDMDGDEDLDLYVASGGNMSENPHVYHDRLYRNDGKGSFSYAQSVLPEIHANSSCVKAADFDADGDMDLFIGGLLKYGRYPYPGQSVLLKNNNGTFENITADQAPDLENIGMVTDAVWSDVNGDNKIDLIVVGEWMAPTLFVNQDGKLIKDEGWLADAQHMNGWYMHVNQADLNGDNKPDFVLGNFGMNNKFHPSVEKPLKVYSTDFDGNETNDIVLAKKYKNNYVPVRGRECSSEQMPFVSEKFKTYNAFANASIESILSERIDEALQLSVSSFTSGVLVSQSDGYSFVPFPAEAQFFPVMSSVIKDFNKDGISDVLLVGNFFDAEVETTRHDSGNGLFLKGLKDGAFEAVSLLNSGFYAPFNSRSLTLVPTANKGRDMLVVGSSNNQTLTYRTGN